MKGKQNKIQVQEKPFILNITTLQHLFVTLKRCLLISVRMNFFFFIEYSFNSRFLSDTPRVRVFGKEMLINKELREDFSPRLLSHLITLYFTYHWIVSGNRRVWQSQDQVHKYRGLWLKASYSHFTWAYFSFCMFLCHVFTTNMGILCNVTLFIS